MRVLLISWEYPPVIEGGLGRHVRKLSESLVRDGVEVHVLTRGGGRLPAEADQHGVLVHRVREPQFPKDPSAFVRWVDAMNADMHALAAELCERFEFDLVHSHDWLVAGAAQLAARQIERPWLVTVHATEFGRHQGWVQNHPQSHIHAAERAMVRRADHVITCSRYMRVHVANVFGVRPAKITAIPNGIDPRDLEPVDADLDALRAKYAAPDDLLVLLVGRLVYEKGFHLALDALAPIIRRHRRGALRGRRHRDRRGRAQAPGPPPRPVRPRRVPRLGRRRHAPLALPRVGPVHRPLDLRAVRPGRARGHGLRLPVRGRRHRRPARGRARRRHGRPALPLPRRHRARRRARAGPHRRRRAGPSSIAEAREHVLGFDWTEVARRTAEIYDALAAGAITPAR